MASTANRIIKNTGFLYAKMGITMFISLYTTRLILNSLGASDFGIFNIVGGAIAMLGFLNAAMASATQRFMSYSEGAGEKEKKKSIFNTSILLHIFIAIIVGLSLLVLGFFFFDGILNIPENRIIAARVVYGSLIFSTVFSVMSVPYEAVLNAHENMRYYAMVGILESILKLIVALIVVYTAFDKLILYGVLMACIPFVILCIMRIYCHNNYDECIINFTRYFSRPLMKEMCSFAGWNFLATAAAMITNSGVGIVMNMFFGTLVNAAQGIANQICGQLMSLTNVMAKAVNPVITKTEGAHLREKTIEMSITTTKALYFTCSIIALPAILVMNDLMKLWLKNNVPPFAVFFAQCQLLIFMCEQLCSGFSVAINATGKIKGISLCKAIFKISYLPLSYMLFSLGFNVVTAYICLVAIQGFLNGIVIPVYFINKELDYSPVKYYKDVFQPAIIPTTIVFVTGFYLLQFLSHSVPTFIGILVCSIISYTILFYFIATNRYERDQIKSIIGFIKGKMMS